MKLDGHGYSAAVLLKILTTAGHIKSYKLASEVLSVIGEIYVSPRHINRLTQEIGEELQDERDQGTENYIHHRRVKPTVPAPHAGAVLVDGGRMMTREPDQGPGVHGQQWKEDKVACVLKLEGPTFCEDPHPQPPKCFLDAPYVDQIVREIQSQHCKREENELPQLHELRLGSPLPSAATTPQQQPAAEAQDAVPWPPKRKDRTCVATMANSEAFGKMVAAEAYQQNLHAAKRRAFLGDGSKWIWTIQSKWFKNYTAIADFVHPLTYLYVAATVLASSVAERWQQYVTWMAWCWQGHCADVIADMESRLQNLHTTEGRSPPNAAGEVLQKTITYLQNNCSRMDYPSYRREGLPITSSAVESLIKEINQRVKGTEKFWNRPQGGEAILQIRAALLSDDDRLVTHIAKRPGSCFRRNATRQTSQAA